MPVERTELGVGGVCVGVEVDEGQPPPTDLMGDAGGVGKCDGMVASEHHRYAASPGHRGHGLFQAAQRFVYFAREHLDIAQVDDP